MRCYLVGSFKVIIAASLFLLLFIFMAPIRADERCLELDEVLVSKDLSNASFCDSEAEFLAKRALGETAGMEPFPQKIHEKFPSLLPIHQLIAGKGQIPDEEVALATLETAQLLLNSREQYWNEDRFSVYTAWILKQRAALIEKISQLNLDYYSDHLGVFINSLLEVSEPVIKEHELDCFVKIDHPNFTIEQIVSSELFANCIEDF